MLGMGLALESGTHPHMAIVSSQSAKRTYKILHRILSLRVANCDTGSSLSQHTNSVSQVAIIMQRVGSQSCIQQLLTEQQKAGDKRAPKISTQLQGESENGYRFVSQ